MATVDAGLRIQHRYVLRARIGAGGMSQVWSADDEVLGRPVAVKVLSPRLAADPALRAGVRAEARAVARLEHPHITQVHDYGEIVLPDGTYLCYLVMELLDGQTLAARLTSGPLPWPEAVRLTVQVATALATAHRSGLVHRDVKPGNVMLTPTGAKVLDFGIAAVARPARRIFPVSRGLPRRTTGQRRRPGARQLPPHHARPPHQPGNLPHPPHPAEPPHQPNARPADRTVREPRSEPPRVGTPAYAAPEWLVDAPPDPAADVYGLGALLYEALTDQPAVRARNWGEAAETHRTGAPLPAPDVPGLPPRVAGLCLACLAPNPRRRPRAAEVAAELEAVAAAAAAQPDGRMDEPVPAGRAWRPGLALVTAAVAGVLSLALASAALLDRGSPPGEAAVAAPPSAAATPAGPGPTVPEPTGVAGPLTSAMPSGQPSTVRTDVPPPPGGRSSPTAVVDEFERRLAEAVRGGRVRTDVALDLRNELTALRQKINLGASVGLWGQVAGLRKKLTERLAEKAIDPHTAGQLLGLLDRLQDQP